MESLMILFKNNIMLMTPKNININIMLHDEKHPLGYSYCLTMALIDIKFYL